MSKPKIIAIVGPTAAGKTSLSIKIAQHCKGEVISADSRQVYKGLDIGSGKVTNEEMRNIPHHLLDIIEPAEIYTAADFKRDAEIAITDIVNRKQVPIIAGGTFFYLDLLRGNMQAAPVEPDLEFRKSLESFSTEELFEKLTIQDPKRAGTVDPHNRRRLERSLEIIHTLGHVPELAQTESDYDWLIIGIEISKEQLHKNIHTRLLQRMEEGMLEEATKLHADGLSYERMESLGLEYRYMSRLLKGELTRDECLIELETKIKQFAKRQMTWLKRDKDIVWHSPTETKEIMQKVDDFLNS